MNTPFTAVMYHYIRPADHRLPHLHRLEPEELYNQIRNLKSEYDLLLPEEAIQLIQDNGKSAHSFHPAVLTFDDGLREHVSTVTSLLEALQVRAFFFPLLPPPDRLFRFHRLQVVLAGGSRQMEWDRATQEYLRSWDYSDSDYGQLRRKWGLAFGYDNAETIFIKRLVQRALPEHIAEGLATHLFERFVGDSEVQKSLARQWYASLNEWKAVEAKGNWLGGHTLTHPWLEDLTPEQQRMEISANLEWVSKTHSGGWVFAYPYGNYNSHTLAILSELKCAAAFNTVNSQGSFPTTNPLEIPRRDTNEFAKI